MTVLAGNSAQPRAAPQRAEPESGARGEARSARVAARAPRGELAPDRYVPLTLALVVAALLWFALIRERPRPEPLTSGAQPSLQEAPDDTAAAAFSARGAPGAR